MCCFKAVLTPLQPASKQLVVELLQSTTFRVLPPAIPGRPLALICQRDALPSQPLGLVYHLPKSVCRQALRLGTSIAACAGHSRLRHLPESCPSLLRMIWSLHAAWKAVRMLSSPFAMVYASNKEFVCTCGLRSSEGFEELPEWF